MKKFKWITLFLMFLTLSQASAQNDQKKDSLRTSKVQELRDYREGLFVDRLKLNDAEKTKFFLVYDEYQLKLRDSKQVFRLKWKDKSPVDMTDAEAESYFREAIALRKMEVQLMETYTIKLKPVIGMKRAVQLPKIEREIKKDMIAKARSLRKKKKVNEGEPASVNDERSLRRRKPANDNSGGAPQ